MVVPPQPVNPSAAATAMTVLACSDRSDGSFIGDALIALPGWQVCEATHDGFEQSLMSRELRHKRE